MIAAIPDNKVSVGKLDRVVLEVREDGAEGKVFQDLREIPVSLDHQDLKVKLVLKAQKVHADLLACQVLLEIMERMVHRDQLAKEDHQ